MTKTIAALILLTLTACGQAPTDRAASPNTADLPKAGEAPVSMQDQLKGSWALESSTCPAQTAETLTFNETHLTMSGRIYCDTQMHTLQNFDVIYADGFYTASLYSELTGACAHMTQTRPVTPWTQTYNATVQGDELTVSTDTCTKVYRKQ